MVGVDLAIDDGYHYVVGVVANVPGLGGVDIPVDQTIGVLELLAIVVKAPATAQLRIIRVGIT